MLLHKQLGLAELQGNAFLFKPVTLTGDLIVLDQRPNTFQSKIAFKAHIDQGVHDLVVVQPAEEGD